MIFPTMLARSRHRLTSHSCFGILLSLVAVLSALGCSKGIVARANEPEPTNVTLREGDYLSSTYIDTVKKTRSPLMAAPRSDHGVQLVTVKSHGNLFHLCAFFDFDDAGELFVLHPDGSITVDPNSLYISNLAISVLSQDSFRLGFDDRPHSFKNDYVFVQDAEAYVAKIVLVGTYKDRHGLSYEFREDGWAVFPDRKFKFEIGMSHGLFYYDYFMDEGQAPGRVAPSVVAFKWNGRALQLFRTKKEDGNGLDEIIDRRPYLSLQLTP